MKKLLNLNSLPTNPFILPHPLLHDLPFHLHTFIYTCVMIIFDIFTIKMW